MIAAPRELGGAGRGGGSRLEPICGASGLLREGSPVMRGPHSPPYPLGSARAGGACNGSDGRGRARGGGGVMGSPHRDLRCRAGSGGAELSLRAAGPLRAGLVTIATNVAIAGGGLRGGLCRVLAGKADQWALVPAVSAGLRAFIASIKPLGKGRFLTDLLSLISW